MLRLYSNRGQIHLRGHRIIKRSSDCRDLWPLCHLYWIVNKIGLWAIDTVGLCPIYIIGLCTMIGLYIIKE